MVWPARAAPVRAVTKDAICPSAVSAFSIRSGRLAISGLRKFERRPSNETISGKGNAPCFMRGVLRLPANLSAGNARKGAKTQFSLSRLIAFHTLRARILMVLSAASYPRSAIQSCMARAMSACVLCCSSPRKCRKQISIKRSSHQSAGSRPPGAALIAADAGGAAGAGTSGISFSICDRTNKTPNACRCSLRSIHVSKSPVYSSASWLSLSETYALKYW